MSRLRMWIVTAGIGLVVAGHAWDAYWRDEHWPFSSYPMFAHITRAEPFSWNELVGVTPDGKEVNMWGDRLGVMRSSRVIPALSRMYRPDDPQRVGKTFSMVRALLKDYERRRELGEHDGPPLAGARLYKNTWDFDWQARNRKSPRKDLLVEIMAKGATTRPTTRPATNPTTKPSTQPAPASIARGEAL